MDTNMEMYLDGASDIEISQAKHTGEIMSEIIYSEESYKIMGACFNVYNDKGSGFLEPVYQECMNIELEYQKIPFSEQEGLDLFYRDKKLKHTYEPDFICYNKIILELKAAKNITDGYRAQVMNYLKATQYRLGIIVNFGYPMKLQYERIVM